jgi:hypothetical protein
MLKRLIGFPVLLENMSWLLYLHNWTPWEEEYVGKEIQKIVEESPGTSGNFPFKEMKSILTTSNSLNLIPHRAKDKDKSTLPTTAKPRPEKNHLQQL